MHVGVALVMLEDGLQLLEQARETSAASICSRKRTAVDARGCAAPRRSRRRPGSKRSASWTTSLVSPRSLWSTRPRTSTIASASIDRGALGLVGLEDEHLDLALEVVERREHHRGRRCLVRIFFASVIDAADGDPGAVLLARRARRASSRPAARSASRTSLERVRRRGRCRASPSPSPAARAGRTRRRGSAGAGGAGDGAAPPPPSPSPRSKIEPWPIWASSWAFWPAACAAAAPRACPCAWRRSSRARRT